MRLVILIALPLVVGSLGQALRGIRIVATGVSIIALGGELMILRAVQPDDVVNYGAIILSLSPFSNLLLTLFIFLAAVIVLFNHGTRQDGLTAATLFVLGIVASVLLLNNFLLITLLIEIIGVGIVLFTGGPRPTRAGVGAAARYLVAAVIATVCLIIGFMLIDVYRLSAENAVLARLVLAFMVIGFGIRLCGFPFHFWLPDLSHHSPAMVTALIVSVLSLTVLAFLITVLSTLPWIVADEESRTLLATGGMAGALAGAVLALGQPSINRLLAYSTVSDVGLILFGLGTVTNLGLMGAVSQAITMAVGNLLLLMCSGIVTRCCGENSLTRLGGLAPKLPVTTIGFIVGGLSVAGYPPFAGFSSRWIMLNVAGKYQGLLGIWIVLVSGILLLAYARAFREVFLGEASTKRVSREPFLPSLLILGMALIILAVGIYPSPLFSQIQTALSGISLTKVG